MTINYPTTLDTTTELPNNRADATVSATSHPEDHNDLANAVLALEAKVGVDRSTVRSSLDSKVKAAGLDARAYGTLTAASSGAAATNTATIEAAIAAAAASDVKTVLLPAGTYYVDDVQVDQAVTLRGHGGELTTLAYTSTTGYALTMSHGYAEAEHLRMLPDTDKRSLSSGVWTLGHYFNVYANDRYAVARDEHGPMIERDFTLTLHEEVGLRIVLFGRIDLILRNMVTGQRLPADHKTSSQMGADFFNRIKPNHQYTGYVLGAEQVLGEPVSEFLINGIQVKPRPLTARGGPPTFSRQITTRTPEDFTEFRDVVVEATKRYLGWAASGVWPLGPVDACASWGRCEFLDVCSAPNALRTNILRSKFTDGND